MKILGIAIAALALASCTSNSSHTLTVEGEPDAVARFVGAEQARSGKVTISYVAGGQQAQFSVPTAKSQTQMKHRAGAAKLAVTETRRVGWSLAGIATSSTTTTLGDPVSSQGQDH